MDGQSFKVGQTVTVEGHRAVCRIEAFLGSGSQGEVYRVSLGGNKWALKWYWPQAATESLWANLWGLLRDGPPDERFLWPLGLATATGRKSFGYLMPLREARFKSIDGLMSRTINPPYKVLAMAGYHLADAFLNLHSKGLAYRDINFGNVFLDPATGDVMICDNDNVAVNDPSVPIGVWGTPTFMAPEIVLAALSPNTRVRPNADSDRWSLAVLLFFMFVFHHPLFGRKEHAIHSLDPVALIKLCGKEPVFIFDENDPSNRPVPGAQQNAVEIWPILPVHLKRLFQKTFSEGRSSPSKRTRESEWKAAMIQLRDLIVYGPSGAENFYDVDKVQRDGRQICHKARQPIQLPPRLRILDSRQRLVMLNHDTTLYPHHLCKGRDGDLSKPQAQVSVHPSRRKVWGLKNMGDEEWTTQERDGSGWKSVPPGRSTTIQLGRRINFGSVVGMIEDAMEANANA